MNRLLITVAAAIFLLIPTIGSSHQTGTSVFVAHVKPDTNEVDTALTFPAIDLIDHLGRDDGDEQVSAEEWSTNKAEIEEYLDRAITVKTGVEATDCETFERRVAFDGTAVTYLEAFRCEDFSGGLELQNAAMTEMTTGYSHIGRIKVGDSANIQTTAFNGAFDTYEVVLPRSITDDPESSTEADEDDESGSLLDLILRFVWQGIIHIVLGLDHILFVAALVLISRRLTALLGVITAFTLSHSVTLALSTLDVVTVPASVVEPIIAASIAYVAFEAWFRDDEPRYIYVTTFLLGLVHGFGFSYVLADVGLPKDALVPALFSFNVGVELGQVAFILALWPLRRLMLDKKWEKTAVRTSAAVLGAVAIFWFVERVFF